MGGPHALPSRNAIVAIRVAIVSDINRTIDRSSRTPFLHNDSIVVVVADVQAQSRKIDVAVVPEEQCAEDGLRQQIQDAVKDSLGITGDDISALAETPRNGVQDPKERC